MTTDIEDLLTAAADDSAQPLRHSVDDVVRRGRRSQRMRRTAGVAAGAVAAAVVITGVTMWTDGGVFAPVQPAGPPVSGYAAPFQPPPSNLTDAQIIQRCQPQDSLWQRGSRKAGGGTGSISSWSVAISQAKGTWIRAILLSPDRRSFAFCQHDTSEGGLRDDYLREDLKHHEDFVVWTDENGAEGPVPKGVAAVEFEVDGVVSPATVRNGFLLWHTTLDPLKVRDKPIWAIFYGADGREIARFDSNTYNPSGGTGTAPRSRLRPIYPK